MMLSMCRFGHWRPSGVVRLRLGWSLLVPIVTAIQVPPRSRLLA
jgi:hypothetical protein